MNLENIRFGVLDLFAYLAQTVNLAPAVEALGYTRYWITENPPQPSPLLMATLAAGLTERIRVGTAAILLHFYSPLKAAYDFQFLEAAYAGRIDAGFCASWARPPFIEHLLDGRPDLRDPATYQRRAEIFIQSLRTTPEDTVSNETAWVGAALAAPEIWVHGLGAGSAALAAEHGIAFSTALFQDQPTDTHVVNYRRNFRAQGTLSQPRVALTVTGVCAATNRQAQELVGHRRPSGHVPNIVGTPDHWLAELARLAAPYQPDDLIIMDLCNTYEDRLTSYTLLAEALGLRSKAA